MMQQQQMQQQQMQLTPEQQAQMQAAAMEQCRVAIAASGIKPQERPDVTDVEGKHYQTIYPQYLDQNLTTHQGRRLPKAKAVPGPMAVEIYKSCEMLGLPVMFEPGKGYSRNSTIRRGRVRVLIKRPRDEHYIKKSDFDEQTRGLVHPEIPSKVLLGCSFFVFCFDLLGLQGIGRRYIFTAHTDTLIFKKN